MDRYILQKNEKRPYWWAVTDTEARIVLQFEEGNFNETQRVTLLDDDDCPSAAEIAHLLRLMGEWIYAHNPEIL